MPLPQSPLSSLRARLLALLLVVGLLPVIGFAGYKVWFERTSEYARAEEQLEARVADGVALLELRIADAEAAIRTLAANPVLTDPSSTRDEHQAQLLAAKRLYPAFEDITLVTPSGQVVGSTDFAYGGAWGSKPWFRAAVEGRPAMSAAHLGGAPLHLIVVFASPVFDAAGEVHAVVFGQMPIPTLAAPLEAISVSIDAGGSAALDGLYLLDDRGNAIAGPDGVELLAPTALQPRPGIDTTISAGGALWHAHPVPGAGWWVAARINEGEVFASTGQILRETGVAAAVSAFAVSILAIWLSRRLSNVVYALSSAISRIGDGHLDERMTGVDLEEFRSVVRAFNEMARRLELSQEETRRSEEWFRSLVSYGSDVIWVVAPSGEVTYVGPSVERLLGLQSDALVGRHFVDLIVESDRLRAHAALRASSATGGATVEHGLHGVPAARIFESHLIDLTGVPAVGGIVLNMREVTERKALEANVERAIELDRLKTEFVGLASHELRTPLTGILGFSELLLESCDIARPEHAWLTVIVSEAERLSRIIEDLLNVSRIESGALVVDCVPVDLAEAIEIAVRSAGTLATTEHELEVDVPADLWVWADRQKLIEVFENLLSNALKYSPAGGRVRIAATPGDDHVACTVSDEGLGIPEGALDSVFQRFKRVDRPDRAQIRGTGLGLYFVQRVVEAFGGTIEVRSELGAGSEFTVTLVHASASAGDTSSGGTQTAA